MANEWEQETVIVEATPHYRAEFHPTWVSAATIQKLAGRRVKVVGQLLYDNDHANASDNCGYPKADMSSCWRGTAWELHPVTQLYLCKAGNSCTADSPASDWQEFK
jgi:hypothetical protein